MIFGIGNKSLSFLSLLLYYLINKFVKKYIDNCVDLKSSFIMLQNVGPLSLFNIVNFTFPFVKQGLKKLMTAVCVGK